MNDLVRGGHAGVLLVASTVAAWLSGVPLIFPSLGPSAYALATAEDPPRPRVVVGGHAVGVVVGALAYHAFAEGLVVTTSVTPGALAALQLGVAGVASVAGTTAVMRALSVPHAPACATTLIVSLGLLTTPTELVGVVASVVVLVAAHEAIRRAFQRAL